VILKKALHVVLNLKEAVTFLFVGHKHIRVDFVDENFVVEVRLYLARLLYEIPQTYACGLVLWALSVDHIDKGSTAFDMSLKVILEDVVAGEVYDIEVNIVIGLYRLRFYLLRREQKVGLVRS